jgi:lysophospholipase L1-like esterase
MSNHYIFLAIWVISDIKTSSITWGAHSTDGNGYRGRLHDLLTARGNKVDFVGGTSTGTMADNDHEGHRGFEIDAIRQASTVGIYTAPNIALVHAGANDMKYIQDETELANTPERLGNLIDDILKYSPDALVLVCQIIPASPVNYLNTATRIPDFNTAVSNLVAKYGKDQEVLLVNMNEAVSVDELFDGLHPNNIGYGNMADKFYTAIEDVDGQGLISKPGTPTDVPTGTNPNECKPTPSWYRVPDPIALGASVYATFLAIAHHLPLHHV